MVSKRKYTLEDRIIIELLEGIAKLDNSLEGRDIVVAGGMAGQFYTKIFSDYWRPTMDIDCATRPYLSKPDFDVLAGDLTELLDDGFSSSSGKSHNNYEIIYHKNDDTAIVHFDRFSKNYDEKVSAVEEKKVNDANIVNVPDSDFELKIVRPEQYLNGKLKRLSRFNKFNDIPEEKISIYFAAMELDFDELSNYKILKELDDIIEERDILTVMPKDYETFQERLHAYKRDKDIYDICLLSKAIVTGNVEFDKDYMKNIMKQIEEVYGPMNPQKDLDDFVYDSGI